MNEPAGRIPYLPERIRGLADLATNLIWSWTYEARALFRSIDQPLWHRTRHNPIALLQRIGPERLAECARDPVFLALYDTVMATCHGLCETGDSWFRTNFPDAGSAGPVAYFCAEFGLHNSVPIYSGGLGILAGDHCKSASDLGVPLVGVGLLYTQGYFDQRIDHDGRQTDASEPFDPAITPLSPVLAPDASRLLTTLTACGRTVHVAAFEVRVGRVRLFLLDTDLEQNDPADRALTHKLYAGGPELRLRQEWTLGVGGVRVLRALGLAPAAWHANEGHAAFMLVERVRELVAAGVPYAEALRRVRATSVFTTHTPVPAGHDVFEHEQLVRCTGPIWEELRTERDAFLRLGYHPEHDQGTFHMTAMAIRLSGRVNGVSARHARETRRRWRVLWPERETERVPIGQVTNGAHVGTWTAHIIREMLDAHLGPDWLRRADGPGAFDAVLSLDAARLWAAHVRLKGTLLEFLREEARERGYDFWKDPLRMLGCGLMLSASALTVGFARRFATYKRSDLLFRDVERLRRLVTNSERPVQFVFAGKAHPADEPGKQMLQRVFGFTRDPRFEGRIAFVEDYELHAAHRLVQGVDLWMNLPRPPMEACGTSGMKAALNGVPQVSTLDGWWPEGYTGLNGWSLPLAAGDDVEANDAADAEHLYALLENEVVPLYYDRNAEGIPLGWVGRMREAMRTVLESFTAHRAVREYTRTYYVPAMKGELCGDDPTA